MSQYDDVAAAPPVAPATMPPPVTPPVTTTPTTTPTTIPDYTPVYDALEDLQLQESTITEMLAVIEEAGRAIVEGAPRWVDPEMFGDSKRGRRMARHTLRAQNRVMDTLDNVRTALAQHHLALSSFREGMMSVEAETEVRLAAVRARIEDVTS